MQDLDYWLLMKLLDSPSALLQQRALDILIELASKPIQEKNQFLRDSQVNQQPVVVKELFAKFSGNTTFAARLFLALKSHENHPGMQTMITEAIGRKENDSIWQELVCSYLNLSPDVVAEKVAIERPSIQQYISAALLTAQQCNSVSNNAFRSLLNASTQTGFAAHIDSQVVATLSCQSLLLDETTPFTERVKIVDVLCVQNRAQLPNIKVMINRLTQSAFKEYACTLVEILESGTSAQDVAVRYPKLVKFRELHAQHPELPAIPEAFTHFFGEFYDPFRMVRAEDKLVIPFGDFSCTQLGTQPLLFGYMLNDTGQREDRLYYRLYAYDLNGLPVWASPFTHAKSMPFKLFGQHLFCPTPAGIIIQYDQASGTVIGELPVSEPCTHFFITPKGILYSIGKESITIYDLHTKQRQNVARTKTSITYYANSVGEQLVFPSDNNLVLLNPDSTSTNLTTGIDDSKLDFKTPASGTDRYLLYATKEGTQAYLACFDRANNAPAWKHPLACPMKKPAIVLPEEKKYFVLTKKMIIALESPEGLGQSPREVWRLSLDQIAPKDSYVHFENIILSPDKKTVLVIADFAKSAEIIRINIDNGSFNSLGYVGIDWGITLGYAGTYQDKVYLEHLSTADARSCL